MELNAITWPWENFWHDLGELLMWLPRRLWELLLEGLAAVINAIPVPTWANDVGSLFSGLPTGIAWGFYIFNLGTGLTIVVSAFVVRFLIRRIPLIG